MYALTNLLPGALILAGMIVSLFGSNRTRALGIAGFAVWLVGQALVWAPAVITPAHSAPLLAITLSRLLTIAGIGLLALSAILPPGGRTAPVGPGGYRPHPGAHPGPYPGAQPGPYGGPPPGSSQGW